MKRRETKIEDPVKVYLKTLAEAWRTFIEAKSPAWLAYLKAQVVARRDLTSALRSADKARKKVRQANEEH